MIGNLFLLPKLLILTVIFFLIYFLFWDNVNLSDLQFNIPGLSSDEIKM